MKRASRKDRNSRPAKMCSHVVILAGSSRELVLVGRVASSIAWLILFTCGRCTGGYTRGIIYQFVGAHCRSYGSLLIVNHSGIEGSHLFLLRPPLSNGSRHRLPSSTRLFPSVQGRVSPFDRRCADPSAAIGTPIKGATPFEQWKKLENFCTLRARAYVPAIQFYFCSSSFYSNILFNITMYVLKCVTKIFYITK